MLEFMGDRNQARKFYENNRSGDLITNKEEVLMQCEDFFKELQEIPSRKSVPEMRSLDMVICRAIPLLHDDLYHHCLHMSLKLNVLENTIINKITDITSKRLIRI
uniref:Uncharacterized protein n=1 Tax=Megaselia scalaris TaxID=36166 RepID=T1H5J0_MEGSC